MTEFDILIVGAGIIGAAAARELARAGMRVGIVEANFAGGGITAAGMGHVVVMDDSPAQLALTAYSRSLWLEDAPHFPAGVEYESRGTIWVAADDEEMAQVYAKKKTYAEAGVAAQVMDARALAQAEPNLRSGVAGAAGWRGVSAGCCCLLSAAGAGVGSDALFFAWDERCGG